MKELSIEQKARRYDEAIEQTLADNLVDACYEMIIKLHELNLL